jgi:two-component system, OmpR family, sensor histidine kinase SenX3
MTFAGWVALGAVALVACAALAVAASERRRRQASAQGAADEADAHRRREADLAERVDTREEILSTIGDGIVLFAPDGRVVYANPAARDLLGRRFASATEVTPESLRDAVARAAGAGAPGGLPAAVEHEFETGGRTVAASALPAGQGAVVVVARDVTAARNIERVRRDFVANASHELKTPVASIQALAETLHDAAASDPEVAERFLARLREEAVRLSRLVGDLLDLSRLEGGLAEAEPVHLRSVVADEAERLRARADGAGVRLVVDDAPDLVVRGSSSDLGLLLHNLLDNAIRYSPDGGEVRITLRDRDHQAELRIADTGLGIPGRDLDRIFERFYRVDPARSRGTGGTGLGLAIVRHVAESHGGDVEVRSVLGAGSTFIVRLPLAG